MNKSIPFVNLKKQYHNIKQEINKSILEVLESGDFIMGDSVIRLEREVAKYIGVSSAVSCSSGTSALVMALRACEVGAGDEVITCAMSFFATAEAIVAVGARPVFVDIDPDSYTIDCNKIQIKITKKTKAIIPVHLYGQSSNMTKIIRLARKHSLFVIEDACQSFGAKFNDKMLGSIGDVGCFSFFPTKNLGAYGDGGIVTTNNSKIALSIRALRSHGGGKEAANCGLWKGTSRRVYKAKKIDKYNNFLIGYNSRLDEIQAAILLVKLKKVDKWNAQRINNAKFYSSSLRNSNLKLPQVTEGNKSVFHHYILVCEKRDQLKHYLEERGIQSGIYYPVPLHLQPAMKKFGYKKGDFPIAESLALQNLSIPVYPELTVDEKRYIVKSIQEFIKNG